MKPGEVYVNFGFWGTVPLPPGRADGYHNRLVEDEGGRAWRAQGPVLHVVLLRGGVLGRATTARPTPRSSATMTAAGGWPGCTRSACGGSTHVGPQGRMAGMALADVFERVAGPDAPVEFRAYDGSAAGTAGRAGHGSRSGPRSRCPTSPRRPGSLGLARAYVSGHLDVDGDMYTALARMAQAQAGAPGRGRTAAAAARARRARSCCCRGCRRRRRRCGSAAAGWAGGGIPRAGTPAPISHHYDVSNTFYEWVLGPSMAYTCACYPREDAIAGGGAGTTSTTWSPGSWALRARDAAAGRRLRLGRHGAARRPRVRGQGARGHPVRAAGRVGAAGHRASRGCPGWPRCATSTTGTCRRPVSTR